MQYASRIDRGHTAGLNSFYSRIGDSEFSPMSLNDPGIISDLKCSSAGQTARSPTKVKPLFTSNPTAPYHEQMEGHHRPLLAVVHKGDIKRLHKRIDKLELALEEVSPRRVTSSLCDPI